MDEEQLQPIRDDSQHNYSVNSAISPPKELTDSLGDTQPVSMGSLFTSAPAKNPEVLGAPRTQNCLYGGGVRRTKQLFSSGRPSQVCVPQQTESDEEIEDAEVEEDSNFGLTPYQNQFKTAETVGKKSSKKELQSQQLRGDELNVEVQQMSSPVPQTKKVRLSLQGPSEQSVDAPCGVSLHSNAQIQIPTSQYSPTVKSTDKSPVDLQPRNEDRTAQSYSQMETMKSMDRSQMIGDEYCLLKDLGEGTFGNVKLGKHLSSGMLVAVKILEKKRIVDKADVERVIREIKILKSIRHSHIIKLYEIIETKARIFLIMEYACGGELFDYIVRKDRLTEKEASRFYKQIISGIEFLHSKGIAHRDLKPENLLLDKQKNLKIVDFGLSNTYKTGETLKTACGSPCYAAPEMIAGKRYSGIEVDIWSSGVTLYAMLCGFLPFEDPDTALLYKKILKGDFELPDFLTNRSIKFLKELLCTDPQKRLSLKDIKKHSWLTQFDQKTGGLLERTTDNSMGLSGAAEGNIYNTQIYGVSRANSSLVDAKKEAVTTTQMNIKPQKVPAPQHPNSTSQRKNHYFAQTNQTVSSSITATVSKPGGGVNSGHQKSISETQMPFGVTTIQLKGPMTGPLQARPSTSLKKNMPPPSGSNSKPRKQYATKRPKQQTTLSAIISSPRQPTSGTQKRSVLEDQGQGPQHKSERKPASSSGIKDKLRLQKHTGAIKIDTIFTQQQKQVVTTTQKVRAHKAPTVVNLLNNTMPMPKLMIDLASPSTGGSTDLIAATKPTTTATVSKKDAFKNNLARVAKNSAANRIQSQSSKVSRQGTLKGERFTLKKQMMNQHLNSQILAQQLVSQSRSVVGNAAKSAHSSLSNKRQKSPRGSSQNSSSTFNNNLKISNSASKALTASKIQQPSTFSFVNSKIRNKHIAASTNFQSVHPYTVMAMPLHSSQNNLKEPATSQTTSKKSGATNRISLGATDPSLTKIPKTSFLKSNQSLTSGSASLTSANMTTKIGLLRSGLAKTGLTNSAESQLRNVKIALSNKMAPNFLTDYSNALFSKSAQEQRHVQSLEILKNRNASFDTLQPMRVCTQAVQPEWTTTNDPKKVLEALEELLSLMNLKYVSRKSAFLFEVKLPRQILGMTRSIKCDIELMLLKNAPYVTVVRLQQKVKLKPEDDLNEKANRLEQFNKFASELRQGLHLD